MLTPSKSTLNLVYKGVRFAVFFHPNWKNDCFTVFYADGSVDAMNGLPFHPSCGFCQGVSDYPKTTPGAHLGNKVKSLSELPGDTLQAIYQRGR